MKQIQDLLLLEIDATSAEKHARKPKRLSSVTPVMNGDEWYHALCLHMNTPVNLALGSKDASWHCVPCGLPQFTSGLFDSFDMNTSNPFDILNKTKITVGNNNL